MKLRDYQQKSRDSINDYLIGGRGSNPLVVVPTAGGKSIIIASYIDMCIKNWPTSRFMMLTHQKELIEQNFEKVVTLAPNLDVGIYSAGIGKKQANNQVVFAGIQSIHKKADLVGHIDVVLVDECHLIPKKGNGMYRTFLDAMLEINPNMKVVGFSATPYRLQGGYLYEGKGAIFDGISYEVTVKTLLEQGFITPLTTAQTSTKFDLSGVGVSSFTKDYKEQDLQKACDTPELVKSACAEMVRVGKDRKSWMIFASGIEHSEHIANELNRLGVSAKYVSGSTNKSEREQLLADFKAMRYRAIVNVGVLTTGFDAPNVDLVAMLRPTQSTSLYIQMLGRGVRLFDGKENCLVLDFADNILTHGPFDNPNVKNAEKNGAAAGVNPTKQCQECDKVVAIQAQFCPFCNYIFPKSERELKHHDQASRVAVLSTEKNTQIVPISKTEFHLHQKPNKPDSIRVEYYNGMLLACKEWLCPNHGVAARNAANRFWGGLVGGFMPTDINQAIATLNTHQFAIKQIEITTGTKHAEVVSRSKTSELENAS